MRKRILRWLARQLYKRGLVIVVERDLQYVESYARKWMKSVAGSGYFGTEKIDRVGLNGRQY